MTRSYTKAQRLNDIHHILVKHHLEGITKEAIAEHFGVDRSTIQRDISEAGSLGFNRWASVDRSSKPSITPPFKRPFPMITLC